MADAEGGLTPVVGVMYSAYHAGMHNPYSVGVELTQPFADTPYTDGHYAAAALAFRFTNDWLRYLNQPPIPAVLAVSSAGRGCIGHEDTQQGIEAGKTDPGPQWDWPRFLAMLG